MQLVVLICSMLSHLKNRRRIRYPVTNWGYFLYKEGHSGVGCFHKTCTGKLSNFYVFIRPKSDVFSKNPLLEYLLGYY